MNFDKGSLPKKSLVKLTIVAGAAIAFVLTASLWGSLVENVPADKIVVIQDPIDGELHIHTTAGIKFQKFGKVTIYDKSFQYWFSAQQDQGGSGDQSIGLRFNDGGHGTVSGSVRIDNPLSEDYIRALHVKYGSQEAIEKEIIRTAFERAVYMTGPLMSSKESYAEKRNYMIASIEDQAINGVYKQTTKEEKGIDPITGKQKTVTKVKLVQDANAPNGIARQEVSPLTTFGLRAYNLSINKVKYDATVETQIKKQQESIMAVQTAIADAKKAEQNAIKAEKEGEATAAVAKWKQEEIKATMVTKAEQERDVAKLEKEAAGFTKQKEILLGQGEAERKKLVMAADGALEKKLATYERVNQMYANAMANYKGDWVPKVQMGNSGKSSNGAQDLINMLSAKTAKELALDMSIPVK
ncbi:hypothetical protein KAR91_19850 [Candidatus Pacearchaeota archaeon]|nr:hypothetical protein [Candidatus Pacearchaeota archaeon]